MAGEGLDEAMAAGGHALDAPVRSFFEQRIGFDFGSIRVRHDDSAARAANTLGARAFTAGRNIVFGAGEYAPQTSSGRQLLAHELVHTVQQASRAPGSSGVVQRSANTCPPDWRSIVDADKVRALGMIDRARGQLGAYDGTNPANVATALNEHFHTTSSWRAGNVRANLWIVRREGPLAGYDCADTAGDNTWACRGRDLATTFWAVPGVDIRLCSPGYFGQSDIERSTTLIHEWCHKYMGHFDLGYRGEDSYRDSSTIRAMNNADPYAQLVKDIS